jgi:hypothetical protein
MPSAHRHSWSMPSEFRRRVSRAIRRSFAAATMTSQQRDYLDSGRRAQEYLADAHFLCHTPGRRGGFCSRGFSMPPSSGDSRETRRLLELAAQGDRNAFDLLFEQHRAWLRRLISLRLDDRLKARLDPSDIVQETQMVAYRRFPEFIDQRPMSFRLWLRNTVPPEM